MHGNASSGNHKRDLREYCKHLEFKAVTDEEAEALAVIYFAWVTEKISIQEIAALVKAADLAFSRQMTERDAEIMDVPLARIAFAVLAHRKALAEQAAQNTGPKEAN